MKLKAIVIEISPQDSYTTVRFDVQNETQEMSLGQLSAMATHEEASTYEVGQVIPFTL